MNLFTGIRLSVTKAPDSPGAVLWCWFTGVSGIGNGTQINAIADNGRKTRGFNFL